ncbi:MAG: type II and III secretion system protein family protein [Deltaproteobacteria bacterium]|nr:MAG: type II and III secretion system protein family protein [Deltaproteobacteria bacterium]
MARRGAIWIVGVIIFVLALGATAAGDELLERIQDQEITQTLRLRVGRSKVIRCPFPITRISVANPAYADIVLNSEREIYIIGLAPGVTNLNLWGRGKAQFTTVTVTVEADVTALKEMLHRVLPQEKIGVQAAGNSIVLSGEVSSPQVQETAMALAVAFAGGKKGGGGGSGGAETTSVSGGVQSTNVSTGARDVVKPGEKTAERASQEEKIINLMHVGGVQQVMVEVRVAEINRSVGKRIGINFSGISGSGNFGVSLLDSLTGISDLIRTFGSTSWKQGIGADINAIGGFTGGGILWTMFFSILKEKGLGRILAEPNLITTSGQTASFLAGGEFPIPVAQEYGRTTIEYKKYGVKLAFTPTVLDDGKIAMRVTPEVSEIDDALEPLQISGLLIPGLRVRRTDTHIELKDGQTFALAGLLSENSRTSHSKFPILGDLPILGTLFRSSHFQKNETELVVLATPHLVKPLPTKEVRLPTDSYIEPDDLEFYLLGALEGRRRKQPARPNSSPKPSLPEGFGHQSIE